MTFGKALFVVGTVAVVNSSLFNTGGSFYTWDHDHRTALWPITRGVTPATPGANGQIWNGTHTIAQWIRRWALTWYFDALCPCNWGCPAPACPWCREDDRKLEWLRSGGENRSWNGMHPIFDCDDNIHSTTAFRTWGEPVMPVPEGYQVQATTEVNIRRRLSEHAMAVGPQTNGIVTTTNTNYNNVLIYVRNHGVNGFHADSRSFNAAGIPVRPGGIEGVMVWWQFVYNNLWSYGGAERINLRLRSERIPVPSNTDIMVTREIFVQQIAGTVLGDVMIQQVDGSPFLRLHIEVPGKDYYAIHYTNFYRDLGFYYTKVNEILCGPPADPPLCRSHQQQGGRPVNRFFGRFEGDVAPYVNRTVYEWDIEVSGTTSADKDRYPIISVDRHWTGSPYLQFQRVNRALGGGDPDVFAHGPFAYNKNDPASSFKLF